AIPARTSVVRGHMARRERSFRGQAVQRSDRLAFEWNDAAKSGRLESPGMQAGSCSSTGLFVNGRLGRDRDRADFCGGWPCGGFQLAEPPYGGGCPTADSGSEPGTSAHHSVSAAKSWLEGPDRDEPKLLDYRFGHGPRAAETI